MRSKWFICICCSVLPLWAQSSRGALLVGIDRYAEPRISGLKGARNDVVRLKQLLRNTFSFKETEITTLINEQATREAFVAAVKKLEQSALAGDELLIHFSGYGSQLRDLSGDESDGWDETLVFYDSRTADVPDLSDDTLNDLLMGLTKKGAYITLVLDVGSASGMVKNGSRWLDEDRKKRRGSRKTRKTGHDWQPGSLENIVVMAAAGEQKQAYEIREDGQYYGSFTAALCKALASGEQMTYHRLQLETMRYLRLMSWQIPAFEGALQRFVLSRKERGRPLAWTVQALGEVVTIGGPVLAGMGPGALLRLYDERTASSEYKNGAAAKATLVVLRGGGVTARARVKNLLAGQQVALGDLAIPIGRGVGGSRLNLRIVEKGNGALPTARANRIRSKLHELDKEGYLFNSEPQGPAHALIRNQHGLIELRSPGGQTLLAYEASLDREPGVIAANLMQHARIQNLLALDGDGTVYHDNETLLVRAVRGKQKWDPRKPLTWMPGKANQLQLIPLHQDWRIEVSLASDAATDLLVGGVLMSGDGSMFGFPKDGDQVRLAPGETHTFPSTFIAQLPLGITDHVLVLGTPVDQHVDWTLLTDRVRRRFNAESNTLTRMLADYFNPVMRDGAEAQWRETSAWTITLVPLRVVPQAR